MHTLPPATYSVKSTRPTLADGEDIRAGGGDRDRARDAPLLGAAGHGRPAGGADGARGDRTGRR